MKKRLRYPGSQPFVSAQKDIFFGRDQDIENLMELIELEQSVVLYGKSGLGKSSIIEAGIIPEIKKKQEFDIVSIRFGAYVAGKTTVTPLDIALEALQPQNTWLEDKFPNRPPTLWQALKNKQIREKNNGFLLIFDQFEELFTYPEEQVNVFARQMAEVHYTNIPQSYRELMDAGFDAQEDFLSEEQARTLHERIKLKTLMGIRSDRMSHMNKLKPYLPEILIYTYELKALGKKQAKAAIEQPAQLAGDFESNTFSYHKDALNTILNYLTKNNTQGIESFQLQIFCEYIEELVRKDQHTEISKELIGTDQKIEAIFENYYLNKIKNLKSEDEKKTARRLIEDGLIFATDSEQRRLSLYEGQITNDYGISKELLRKLVNTHLLRAESSMRGGYTYELSHDTLLAPILKAKKNRIKAEADKAAIRLEEERQQQLIEAQKKAEAEKLRAEKEKRLRIRANTIAAIAGVMFCIALAAGIFAYSQYINAEKAKNEAIEAKNEAEETLVEKNRIEIENLIREVENFIEADEATIAKTELQKAIDKKLVTKEILKEILKDKFKGNPDVLKILEDLK